MTFSFLFSGRRPPTHPGCNQKFLLQGGRSPDVPNQGLSGHQKLLPGQESGKNINNFCPNTEV